MPYLNGVLHAISCYVIILLVSYPCHCVVFMLPWDLTVFVKLVGSKRYTNLGTKCLLSIESSSIFF